MGSSGHPQKSQDVQRQLCTFYVEKQLYGIDVTQVQEVVKFMPMSRIPLSLPYVRGLINLRGQVATAVGLREMFMIPGETRPESMNVILKHEGALIALQVDEIGDVMEVDRRDIEQIPTTIPTSIRVYMSGVFQLRDSLLCVIDLSKLFTHVSEAV
ncbi:MAG: chemotaxis protein CheW [Bdellovibrionota bacterium]